MSEGAITEDRVIGTFQKSMSASIQVSLVTWQDNDYLDIREVIPSDKAGERFTFTKKGVRMKAELVEKLAELLSRVNAPEEPGAGPGRETGED